MPKLEIYLFAPFRVLVDGSVIPAERWPGRIPRSLLKVLALSPRGCTSDTLMELFWPDQPPLRARQRLYEAMSRLRRTIVGQSGMNSVQPLSDWPIETLESGYQLTDSAWVDVRSFHERVSVIRKLRVTDPQAAVNLLLNEECVEPDALLWEEPYADWALTARERVYEDVRLLERIKVELLVEQGREADALVALTGALKVDPTCEIVGRQTMELAWRLGDRTTALESFHRLQDALLEELGVQPSAETLELYRRLVEGEPIRLQSGPSLPEEAHRGDGANNSPAAREAPLRGEPPVYLTRFVGREQELREIAEALCSTRLLTLHGMGGSGKTRLALEAVKRVRALYDHGVCWIDLTPAHDGKVLPQMIATALGVRESPGVLLLENVCEALKSVSMLLVMDNCEHILNEVSHIVHTLLRACPGLTIMGTSQAAIGLSGEKIYSVPPLSVPGADSPLQVGGVAGYDGVALFVDRAAAVRNGFRLTPQNVTYVARICRRLDGIPLAIELAATKIGTLSPRQIADRIDKRFQLLRSGHPSGLSRHRSLQALVDWSYDLLPEVERKLWERMSVFAGSFSLETIEDMFQEEMDALTSDLVLDAVSRLVERSLLVAEESGGEMRYRFLETLREYGLLKLQASGETAEMRRRHLRWCLDMVLQGNAVYGRHGEAKWLQRLATEYGEIRAALNWSIQQHDIEPALQLVSSNSLWWFWMMHGLAEEGRSYAEQTLAAAGRRQDALYAMALHTLGPLNLWLGETGPAKTYLLQSLTVMDAAAEPRQLVLVHFSLGLVLAAEGDLVGADRSLRTSLDLARRVNDESHIAAALWYLGNVTLEKGDLDAAKAFFHDSLLLCRRVGYERGEAGCLGGLGLIAFLEEHQHLAVQTLQEGMALSRRLNDHLFGNLLLDYLGWMARRWGDYDRSLSLHQESLRLRWEVRDKLGVAYTLGHLAETAVAHGEYERAARLFGAIQSWRPTGVAGLPRPHAATLDRTEAISRLRSVLALPLQEAAWREGGLMRPEDVIDYALQRN